MLVFVKDMTYMNNWRKLLTAVSSISISIWNKRKVKEAEAMTWGDDDNDDDDDSCDGDDFFLPTFTQN